jgi:hypothetical protein
MCKNLRINLINSKNSSKQILIILYSSPDVTSSYALCYSIKKRRVSNLKLVFFMNTRCCEFEKNNIFYGCLIVIRK